MNRRKVFEFALVILVAALAATPSRAQLNFGTAQSTYVVEPKTGASFVSNNPHWQFTGASTTKAMTMHLVLKAIQSNVIGLNDTIQISKYSTTFNCNCWASAGQKAGHNLVGGELFTVDDALYGVDESFVEPTVSLAEYVANAWFNGKKATGGTNQGLSATLLQQFIDDLMNPEAQALGLNDTVYTSVFGAVNERTSTYDLVTLWTKSSADPLFIQHTGFRRRDGVIKVLQNGVYTPQNYTLFKGYNYYLNVDGDKNGGWGSTCFFLSHATRGGRPPRGSLPRP